MPIQATNYVNGTMKAVVIADIVDKQTPLVKRITNSIKNELTAGDNPTINIKVPGRGHIVEGIVTEADFKVKTNTLIPVTLTKKTSPTLITELDDSTTIEDWKAEVLDPVAENFATDINQRTYKAIMAGVDSAIVSENVNSGKFQDLSDAIAKVHNSRLAGKVTGALNNSLMSQVRNSGMNLFTGGSIAGELYSGFDIANYGGAEFISTADAEDVVYPTAFPSTVSAAVASGSKQIPVSATTVAIPAGVLFTISGVNKVDAEGYIKVGELKVFVTDYTPAGSTFINLKTPIIFTPATLDGMAATQVRNVSALPTATAAITVIGTFGKTYMTGVVFSERIAVNVNRPLSERSKKNTGVVTTTTLAGLNSIQTWERAETNDGATKYSVSRLDAQHPFLGIGGTAYYVRKYA